MLIQTAGIVRDIKRLPAIVQPYFSPGVHSDMLGVIAVDIAADVARRDRQRPAAGEKHMGVILANPFRSRERVGGRVLYLGGARRIGHSQQQLGH